MSNTASLKKEYVERIAPALKSQFQYSSAMQVPVLKIGRASCRERV